MEKQEKLITWALLGFIAYEVYRMNNPAPAPAPGYQQNPTSQTPGWIQQYSYVSQQDESTLDVNGDTIYSNLLSIPQGPGASPDGVTANFFNPAEGILSFCPTPPAGVSSGVDAIAQGVAI